MSLDPVVAAQIEKGRIARLDLIRFDLPGKTVGYHRGGRSYTYNGLVYLPNRFLDIGSMTSAVGTAVTTRTITFSNIPVTDPEDAIAKIEEFDYQNSPVIIAHLCGVPNSNEVLGILASSIYEIDQVRYNKGAVSGSERTLTMEIDLQPPGRSARGSTGVKRSIAEQQFDNSPTDTGLEYVATNATIPEEWGQRQG
ncbi:DUF2163 domain-containing protein [Agrobacterium radiobacter]|uniref:DUF2163 domain-containing protein n=1 Tax=Agrobacterium tumefaciens str. B6 TaxID=1183423 RepID=A0A822UZ17_AGRTU|nr:hypothetical protein [Agrobacterium tumefaciens]KWT87986.1 hypothetical protein ASB65_18290 [Agrobacterium tumefaciens str. B6]MQB28220.1 DUF2163 domain-containing protein [Agrobacterium tumefaciens]NTA04977.1 DUF2163 domain-containing protein [Agrobacterium tumefaciens]NTA91572.1 DUF2163 domain-containing protein [Agrobacterium tumefaciens]NTB12721.1 DUF2163 domain-containing protein [Agrobacterium tumefaciens]